MSIFNDNVQLPEDGRSSLPDDEERVLDKLANKVVDKGWSVPAILFLESMKPLNFIGSQVMVFFEPVVQTVFNFRDYETVRTSLERRESIEILLQKIERYDAIAHARSKRIRKFLKQERKKWKWYQRYLGLFTPRVDYPPEVLHGSQATDAASDSKSSGKA
ncbi:MAG: hypothetical protein ACE5FH_02780 [Candidatus Zixiibacteriota bacterium]